MVWARVASEVGLCPLGWGDYDYCAIAAPLEFVVAPRNPRRGILDNHRRQVVSVVLRWLVPPPWSALVVCNVLGGDAAEARQESHREFCDLC